MTPGTNAFLFQPREAVRMRYPGGGSASPDEPEYPVNGAHIDYVETLQQSGFKIDNPNAKKSCGCGHSFG